MLHCIIRVFMCFAVIYIIIYYLVIIYFLPFTFHIFYNLMILREKLQTYLIFFCKFILHYYKAYYYAKDA